MESSKATCGPGRRDGAHARTGMYALFCPHSVPQVPQVPQVPPVPPCPPAMTLPTHHCTKVNLFLMPSPPGKVYSKSYTAHRQSFSGSSATNAS